jgi:PucR-like helix-turn-helix protein
MKRKRSLLQVREAIGERLRGRRDEIEQELLARLGAFSRDGISDPEYVDGLRRSVAAALEFGIEGIESSERNAPQVPAVLYAQARLAARNEMSLHTVMRRYFNGYALLNGFVDEAAEAEELLGSPLLGEVRRASSSLFDCLIESVGEQYELEARSRNPSPESRRETLVRRALAGERIDASELNYDFDAFHLGLVASGAGTTDAIKGLARALDCSPLVVEAASGSTWAWLGRRKAPPDVAGIEKLVDERWGTGSFLSIGEAGRGGTGWRLTHFQAKAGLAVSLRHRSGFFRYGEDPFLVALLHDDLLAESMRQMYLSPLSEEPDGGKKLRRTLRAYFEAERNGASAGEALQVSRQTVKNHLRTVEERVGRPLADCIAEVEAALRLETLDRLTASTPGPGSLHTSTP